MDRTIITTVILIILAGALFWAWQAGFFVKISPEPVKPTVMPEGIVLFYGSTCSHCKNVEDFVSQNKVEDKVKFTRLEVFDNQSNALLLGSTAQSCSIDTSQGVPVPLLWDGKTCIVGDQDIIKFFQDKIK